MALRLRRGTDAQRLLIVPAEGELIYTTDTKRLYIGDGSTAGGVLVNTADAFSIGDLSDVDLGAGPGFGQVLKWDGVSFVPSDDIGEGIIGSGVIEGSNYRINIRGDDSSILVNTANNSFTGNLYGDVYDFVNDEKVIDGDNRLAKVDITTDSDITIVQHNTSNYYDPVGNLLIDGNLRAFFGDVDGSIRGSVYNTDLSVAIVNHLTGQLTGDLKGSVFGDDSSLLVDAVNGTIVAPTLVGNKTFIGNDGLRIRLELEAQELTTTNQSYGEIRFTGITTSGTSLLSSKIISGALGTFFLHDPAGVELAYPEANTIALTNTGISYGTYSPSANLDIRGDAVITGGLTADVKGSVFADDSTVLVDAVNGVIPGYISIQALKDIAASSGTYADFQTAIALL